MKRENQRPAWIAVLPFLLAACASGASTAVSQDQPDVSEETLGGDVADVAADLGTADDSLTDEAVPDAAGDGSQPPADLPPGWECAAGEDCLYLGSAGLCKAWQCSPEHTCQATQAPVGTACVPDDLCFDAGTCDAGACVGTTPKTCDDQNPCTEDSCLPGAGCQNSPLDAVPCDDGDACTQDDACAAGTCKGIAAACDDGNPCTEDFCDKVAGCLGKDVSGSCDDGDPCTAEDACVGGKCTGADQGCECHVDEDCATPAEQELCAVGSYCDTSELPYVCMPVLPECPAPATVCAAAACDALLGGCIYLPANEGKACAEPENCVPDGKCVGGVCTGKPLVCKDDNPCTADSCEPGVGCVFTPETIPCDDGNPCTINDFCAKDGTCGGFDVGCGPAPALPIRLTSLVFEEPTFCLPSGNDACVDATALVNSFISQDISDPDSPFIMLALFDPFDLAGDTSQFFLGPGTCGKLGGEEVETCQFSGQPEAMFPVVYEQSGTCEAAPGITSPAPCFGVAGAGLEIGVMEIAIPVAAGAVTGTFVGLPWPDAIVSGTIGAFLDKKTADAVKVTLPLMPAYQLSQLLDPADLTTQGTKTGWKLLIHYEATAMPAAK
ncbi:MAG: hypothetical protein FJ109_08555 [Deltaproteobacteria bacterium]|nr:hypothetical protein [Deltaproteobacteria bacterium]